ncbi:MAG: serine hydroxymethyltransferase [Deltaproteobacteria bacterium]|nr:MAG: serine hydroxymethyltransferase [Deltaproteobacteria bacterium]
MKSLWETDPEVALAVENEALREELSIILIASENYASEAVLQAQASVMTNKYAEGYPGRRYYGGCSYVDTVEKLAINRGKELFGAEHINVQPNAGTAANMAVYFSVLNPGDTILSMNLSHGGHLSHGAMVSFSGKFYKTFFYGVSKETGRIDYDEVEYLAKKYRPKLIIAGASSYSRIIDFKRFKEIADLVGAYFMADIAHIAGLVAAGIHPSPIPYADFVTGTTHKTLRGPRGGFVMCKSKFAKTIDQAVFPGLQGGPLMHVIAAKAVAFKEAMSEKFKKYQYQIVKNAQTLADSLKEKGFKIISEGTDNHLFLVDLTEKDITGKEAEIALDNAGITVNKNIIPYDEKPPTITSGIRIGTPIVTTRGMKEKEMKQIAFFIAKIINNLGEEEVYNEVLEKVKKLCLSFPVYHNQIRKERLDNDLKQIAVRL